MIESRQLNHTEGRDHVFLYLDYAAVKVRKRLYVTDKTLAALFDTVRQQRKSAHGCPSAQDGVDVSLVLEAIIKEDAYRDDYKNVTTPLLFEDIMYEEAIGSLRMVSEFMRNHSV